MDDARTERAEPDADAARDGDPGEAAGSAGATGSGDQPGQGSPWLGQLQQVIDDLAADASPTMRRLGARAAELAAVAAERAGPFAQRAAELTDDVGQRLAERSRSLADELRRDEGGARGAVETPAGPSVERDRPDEPDRPVPAPGETSSDDR